MVAPSAHPDLDGTLRQIPACVAIYAADGELRRLNPAGEAITRRQALPGATAPERRERYAMRRLDGVPRRP
jgi:hypothetical protein